MVFSISVVDVMVRGRPEFGDVDAAVVIALLCPSRATSLLLLLLVRVLSTTLVMASSLGLSSRVIAGFNLSWIRNRRLMLFFSSSSFFLPFFLLEDLDTLAFPQLLRIELDVYARALC